MLSFETEILTECMVCASQVIEVIDPEAALSRCTSCGYVFDNPRPTLNALVEFYSVPTKYDAWLAEEEGRVKMWQRRLKKMCATARPGNLLDVGAGIGQFLHLARPDFTEVCGTEVSSSAVAIAKEKYGLELFHGTLDGVSLPCESFDNITVFHVLEHVPNPRLMVEKCFSLLRSGGVLVIAVPNDFRTVKSKVRVMLGRLGYKKFRGVTRFGLRRIQLDGNMTEIHLSHFTPKVLRRLLKSGGLQVIQESVDPAHVPPLGWSGLVQDTRYLAAVAGVGLTGINIGDAIWMVARKEK